MIMLQYPALLWLLLLVPAVALFSLWSYRYFCKSLSSLDFRLYHSSLPGGGRRWLATGLKVVAFALVAVALAEPVWTYEVEEIRQEGLRIYFLVDVSGSMVYAHDLWPNRLEAVRAELVEFTGQWRGRYAAGIIPFAGSANRYYCPATYADVFDDLLAQLGPWAASVPGTDIAAAVEALTAVLKADKYTGDVVVFLLSDGGREDSDATNRAELLRVTQQLVTSHRVVVHVVGVGKEGAAPLYEADTGGRFVSAVKDDKGQQCYSALDESFLQLVARAGHGEYANFAEASRFLRERLAAAEGVAERYKVTRQEPLNMYFFALAALLFWVPAVASRTRMRS